jgi:hypothetical protein
MLGDALESLSPLLDRSLVAQRQSAQIICGSLRPAARREERPAIMLQKANPGLDIAGVPHVAVDRELGAKKCCA